MAIGFCDLGTLLTANIEIDSKNAAEPIKFVGGDLSAYAVAKSNVIAQMMRMGCATPSIVEVWYSASWTTGTRDDFMRAVNTVGHHDSIKQHGTEEVRSYISHWVNAEPVDLETARHEWLSCTNEAECTFIGALKNREDCLDVCDLVLTGDVHGRKGTDVEIECASIVMFSNPAHCLPKARNESVLQTIDPEVITKRQGSHPSESLRTAVINLLLERIARLQKRVATHSIQIILMQFKVTPHSSALNAHLKELDATTVSWSNCIDFLPRDEFHALAEAIAPRATHHAYSLAWMRQVARASVLDFSKASDRRAIFRRAKKHELKMWKSVGAHERFLHPSLGHPINVCDVYLRAQRVASWKEYFLCGAVDCSSESVSDLVPCPFARTNSQAFLKWKYE